MKFFIDTANLDQIKEAHDLGVLDGVTTNPSLIAKEGRDFREVIKEIANIVDGPISGEVKATTTTAEEMIGWLEEQESICSIEIGRDDINKVWTYFLYTNKEETAEWKSLL